MLEQAVAAGIFAAAGSGGMRGPLIALATSSSACANATDGSARSVARISESGADMQYMYYMSRIQSSPY
jgi:hypothetical protein